LIDTPIRKHTDLTGQVLSVCYGIGVDSTAMLVGFHQRGIRPDLIIFSDVGAEREATYEYLPVINKWLRSVGFPEVTVVRYRAKNFKHWPAYFTIEENCLTNVTLPSISYGGHSCSSKWKISAQDEFLEAWPVAQAAWAQGKRVMRAIGFEDSPHEHKRSERCNTFAVQDLEEGKYQAFFPLQEWGWDRERCVTEIKNAGLVVPSKSSCYFCCAMKPWEVNELTRDKLMRIVILEARTAQRHIEFADKRRVELEQQIGDPLTPDPDRIIARQKLKRMGPAGTPVTEGIWRKAVKGKFANGKPNGAQAKPGSMTEYIRQRGLLPSPLIDALIDRTPTQVFTRADFEATGLSGWQEWIQRICAAAEKASAQAA
jgi:hypothetical protein